jgi:hypothetical protein
MQFYPSNAVRCSLWLCLVGVLAMRVEIGHAQLEFTEVMHSPIGDENRWEWVEVRNTSAVPINLDGWIFDDDDDVPISVAAASNIKAENGNTIVPANGVAVLYAGSNLDFMPSRYTNAWGSGITLIPVNSLTSLTDADAIGLWPNRAAYNADDLGAGMNPRRSFAHASVSLNYASGFPDVENGRSIAWNGTGSFANGANWVESEVGSGQAKLSTQTLLESTTINKPDRANPGVVPAGAALPGLRITEIMYDPASPESEWEWVEIFNNTGSAINFATQKHVLHDDDGADFTAANIDEGTLAQGGVGVLYNASANTLANMQAAWGSGINFIPVDTWGNGFSNDGDTIAIWSSIENYNLDKAGTGRSTAHAAAAVSYDDTEPWPVNNNRASIYVTALNLNVAAGGSWTRSDDEDSLNSATANPVTGTLIDHPGGDVGSPGFAPGAATPNVLGDYNGNHVVDAADYTLWRNAMSAGGTLMNDASPGSVSVADYTYWKAHFGAPGGSGALSAVPEAASALLLVLAAAVKFCCARRVRPR